MIKFENTKIMNMDNAIRGMRNPMNSWYKSDSYWTYIGDVETRQVAPFEFFIGENDLDLMKKLIKAGSDHRKFLRQIFVSVDITAPQFWWYEFDTYKVGTVRNSCSKMHKIHIKKFVKDDFSHEGIDECGNDTKFMFIALIKHLEFLRNTFNETQDKKYWRAIIELLPSGYNMKATITFNYENILNMYHARKNHKLDEWKIGFCNWIDELPYAKELIVGGNENAE